MIFKIYGERNSGTNFLTKLLKNNFGDDHVFEDYLDLNTSICYFWKHGFPDISLENIDTDIVNIFIFRNLRKWLVSMYHNPYCLDFENKNRTFEYFITQKHFLENLNGCAIKNQSLPKSAIKWFNSIFQKNHTSQIFQNQELQCFLNKRISYHRKITLYPTPYLREHVLLKHLNYTDNNFNVFQIRYNKFISYLDYAKSSNNCLFVSLDNLQSDTKCSNFIKSISDKYKIPINNVKLISRNLKTYQKNKNTLYSTSCSDYEQTIQSFENKSLENKLAGLCSTLNV